MGKHLAVAIDGPSGAGKSTLAKMLAAEFGFIYVDTGALYRAVGYEALEHGIDYSDREAVEALLPRLSIELRYVDGAQRVLSGGVDISDKIRTPAVSMAASAVSAIPAVRTFLFDLQRDIAAHNSVIMDGRDIGTVVLPHADLKIFLTASPEERAQRRFLELQQKGISTTYEQVLEDMKKRDHDDANRDIAPLKPAPDAVLVNTDGYSLEQAFETLRKLVAAVVEKNQ